MIARILRGRHWRIAALLAALIVIAGSFAVAEALRYAQSPEKIAVSATPIDAFDNRDPAQTRFGALEFRGGLELTSKFPAFGGISAFRIEPDGAKFLALTDNGSWLRGRIVYKDGRPSGIADAEMAPILGADGAPIAARGWYDTESLAEDNGTLYVGIERAEQILRFDYKRDGLLARGEPIAVPDDFKKFSFNKSLECLAVVPKDMPNAGTLIVVTEASLDEQGNHRSFLMQGSDVRRFSVKHKDDFEVSDCTVLPSAELLLLERHYSVQRGVAMRMRRIPLSEIKPGAVADGRTVVQADLGYQIDNMEGVSFHKNEKGEIILTLISDDNFSPVQRTILLQFALVGE